MAIKLSITEAKAKLGKVNLAAKHLVESKLPSDIKRKKLVQLKEAKANLTALLTEEKREYTSEESEAVGNELVKTLEKAIRSTKGELASKPEVTGQVNGFNIHTVYGRDKGEDNFKFELNPDDSKIYLKSGKEEKEVAPFEVTEANQVKINATVDLETVLRDLLTKYTSEPTDQDYDAQAEMEPSHDESQINKFIAERKLALRESLGKNATVGDYVEDFVKSDAPQFKGKSKAKRIQMAKAAALKAKPKTMKEDLDIGHEDDEPNMLKGDLYKLMRNAADLYKAMQALEGQGEVDFPQWWQGKIIRASDDIESAKEYLEFEMEEPAIDAAVNTLGEESGVGQVDTKTLKNVKLKNGKTYTNVRFHLPNDPKSFVTTDGGYMINQDIQSVVDADQELREVVFNIAGLGTYTSTKQDADTITGVDTAGTVKTFSRKKIEQDNPGIFDRKPRERKPQGIRPYTESQYRKILQGAIDDAGSTEFAHDIAESMIYDPQILARLKKDYPEASARELKQRLQWDLEACDSPEDNYDDDDYEGEVAESVDEKSRIKALKAKITDITGNKNPSDPAKVTYKGESYLRFRDRKEEPATTAVYYVDANDKVFKVSNGELKQIS